MALTVGVLTGGSNTHQTTSEEANFLATDIMSEGVNGTLGNTSGVAPMTGNYSANAQVSPDMTVAIGTGSAYVTATPSGQNSQLLRVKNSASANVTIASNSSGSTKYDWLYISISAANAANPNSAADNVATLVASRSSSATSDDGTPPTYGMLIAVVTVANGASSITNGTISDRRAASISGPNSAVSFFAIYNFVESGCVWSGDAYASTRNASMTAGVVWIGGVRLTVPAVTARSFTASKDTYVDLKDNGDGTASINYTEATNNAASSALFGSGTTNNTVRIGIIVTGASTIAAAGSVNQGQETMILPIASSIAYSVTDSLGNLICPRDPNRRVLGYRQITTGPTFTGIAQVTGLSVPVLVPTGRKIKATFIPGLAVGHDTNASQARVSLWDGVVNSGTQLQEAMYSTAAAGQANSPAANYMGTLSAGLHTINAGARAVGAGTITVNGAATTPAYVLVELV